MFNSITVPEHAYSNENMRDFNSYLSMYGFKYEIHVASSSIISKLSLNWIKYLVALLLFSSIFYNIIIILILFKIYNKIWNIIIDKLLIAIKDPDFQMCLDESWSAYKQVPGIILIVEVVKSFERIVFNRLFIFFIIF